MSRQLPAALLVSVPVLMSVYTARAAQSLTCLGSQVATVAVMANARTIDNSAHQAAQTNAYRGLILGNLQGLGLRTLEADQTSRAVRSTTGVDGFATIRISVSLDSNERRLTSVYLSGAQWPLRTVTLTVAASATDARTGKLLAAMDVPKMNLAGNSTSEAISDYLAHDFRDALVRMLGVICTEPPMAPPPEVPVAQRFPIASRAGGPIVAGTATSSLRIRPDRHIAIVIGISRYLKLRDTAPIGSHQLTNLRYADADAQAMGELLQDAATTGRRWDVHSFLNAAATTDQLWHFLRDSLENARSDDVILLFFAGHGRPSGPTDVTLMTYDSDAEIA